MKKVKKKENYYETPALKVEQRLSDFFVVVLPADLLLRVAGSDKVRAKANKSGNGYSLSGSQRLIKDQRLDEIAGYIDRNDSTFPNSIILAANHDVDASFLDSGLEEDVQEDTFDDLDDDALRWRIEETEDGGFNLIIPTSKCYAAIIDGQHRLFSFAKAKAESRSDTNLVCSVFLDLPKPYQAQVFATINSTQKRVEKGLTYELFGYNLLKESEEKWTPEKLAVFLTRKLNTENKSPLQGRIILAPIEDIFLENLKSVKKPRVSTAVVVDGFLRLYSNNPRRDSNLMHTGKSNTREKLTPVVDRSPLRSIYIEGNDALIYKMVWNYLEACTKLFWKGAPDESFIIRTTGVQALFDILRLLARESVDEKDISVQFFSKKLYAARNIDFTDAALTSASGSGRGAIRNAIKDEIGL